MSLLVESAILRFRPRVLLEPNTGVVSGGAQPRAQVVEKGPVIKSTVILPIEAEGILHRWHANPSSVEPALRDRAFAIVHGSGVVNGRLS